MGVVRTKLAEKKGGGTKPVSFKKVYCCLEKNPVFRIRIVKWENGSGTDPGSEKKERKKYKNIIILFFKINHFFG